MKKFLPLVFVIGLTLPQKSQGDFWGGDLVYLAQILANAIQQLEALQQVLGTGKDTLGLLRDINKGINDGLTLARTISPYLDPGTYKDLKTILSAAAKISAIYGTAANSPDKQAQSDTDQIIAESITMDNALFDYAKELDELGERIKSFSHDVSPGGAAKLTAQTLAVIMQIQNQQMRAQGQAMKIQAQALALQNKKEKDQTRGYLDQTSVLRTAMKTTEIKYDFPRF